MTLIIALALIGLVLIYLEFFFPSGVSAVVSAGLLVVSVTPFSLRGYGWFWIALYALVLAIAIGAVCLHALRQVKKKVALKDDQEGHKASSFDVSLIGKKGKVLTELKPSGHIMAEGQRLPALSEAGYLAKGEAVVITGVRGSQYLVRRQS